MNTVPLPTSSMLPQVTPSILAERFRELGLTREFIRAHTSALDDLRSQLIPTREAIHSDLAAVLVMRLFFCREDLKLDTVRDCLGDEVTSDCVQCGLLVESGEWLHAPFHVRTVRYLYLFSDYLSDGEHEVMGAGETTAILMNAGTPAATVRRALDLGCGAGTLALLLASHAQEVIGTDINPRAIDLSRANARLNGIENVKFLTGDIFDPVAGERFDCILSQPPYYPAPLDGAGAQTFLHGGPRGDEIARRILEELPRHLTPTGRACLFASWPEEAPATTLRGMRVLELTTNRREVRGTRQSLQIVEHIGPEETSWSARIEIPAECWGDLQPWRIDQMIAVEEILHGPPERLLAASLRIAPGLSMAQEGSAHLVRCASDPLFGIAALDAETWEFLSKVGRAATASEAVSANNGPSVEWLRNLLRRGLLVLVNEA